MSFPSTATFIAHPFSKANLERQAANDRPNGNKTIVPAESVADKKTLKLGSTEIQILFNCRAHTGGDLEVYLPKEKIAFLSEVYSNHIFPSMRTAWPTDWVATLKAVMKLDAGIVVPGHGFIDDPAAVRNRAEIGVSRMMWMSDFPHEDGFWPNNRARLTALLADVPDDEARAIAGGNSAALLRIPA